LTPLCFVVLPNVDDTMCIDVTVRATLQGGSLRRV